MTKLRTLLIGIGATFGLPWLFLIVIPFFQLRALAPVPYDFDLDQRTGSYPPNCRISQPIYSYKVRSKD